MNNTKPGSEFRDRLENLLRAKRLTARQAAKIAGVPASTLQNWKVGHAPSNFTALKRLAEALGTSLSFLLTGEDDRLSENVIGVTEVFKDGGELFDGYLEVKIRRLIPRKKPRN